MDSESESTKSHTESEEDLGCYFLQPASSPYNIIERIHEANVDLYNSNSHQDNGKTTKVKFRDELVSYEPDLTDDDINSIESDQAEVSIDPHTTILEHKAAINTDINIFDIEEEGEEFEEEEVIEDTESERDEDVKHVESVCKPETSEVQIYSGTENIEVTCNVDTESSSKVYNKRKKVNRYNFAFLNPREIDCKSHCIDKFDFDLSMSIQKLDINEKIDLPPLQLHQRKCCDELRQRHHINLPNYKGLRSEYGLTSRQLNKKEKQAETIRLREQTRTKLLDEYRQRKIQQNEEVFVQWLKEVAKRKFRNRSSKSESSHPTRANSAVSNAINRTVKKTRRRPKTAEEVNRRMHKNKSQRPRPHSTHSCVYIEVPQSLLEQGLNIGDLTITSSKLNKRKLHILTFS